MAELFTSEQFLAWARTKPEDERYDYLDNYTCPIAQYLKEHSHATTPYVVNDREFYDDAILYKKKPIMHALPKKKVIVAASKALKPVNTFGHLVRRLESDESDWAFIR